jgi:hypothetical protein
MESLACEHHLEAVELGRIMRTRDLKATVSAQRGYSEVESRSREHSNVDCSSPRVNNSLPHCARQCISTGAIVSSNSNRGSLTEPLVCHAAERLTECAGEFGSQLAVNQAANVVLSEYRLRDVHRSSQPAVTARAFR